MQDNPNEGTLVSEQIAPEFVWVAPISESATEKSPHVPLTAGTYLNEADLIEAVREVNDNDEYSDEQKDAMVRTINTLSRSMFADGRYLARVNAPTMVQKIKGPDGKDHHIKALNARLSSFANNAKGDALVDMVSASIGGGTASRVPLWASRFSVMYGSIPPGDIISLAIRLNEEKAAVGMRTRGYQFSVDDVHINSIILEWCIAHIKDCTIKGWNRDTIRALMLVNDIPSLFTGALNAAYNHGYPFNHACISSSCDYTVLGSIPKGSEHKLPHLNFREMIVTDMALLSPEDIALTTAAFGSVSIDAVKESQSAAVALGKSSFIVGPLNDNGPLIYKVRLEVPNVVAYRVAASSLLNDVETAVRDAMAEVDEIDRKNFQQRRVSYINNFLRSLGVTRDAHWVKEIIISNTDGDEQVVTDVKTINRLLASFSANSPDITETLAKYISKFKEDTALSYTVIQNFECPKCHTPQRKDTAVGDKSRIPVNVTSYFFDIAVLRLYQNLA